MAEIRELFPYFRNSSRSSMRTAHWRVECTWIGREFSISAAAAYFFIQLSLIYATPVRPNLRWQSMGTYSNKSSNTELVSRARTYELSSLLYWALVSPFVPCCTLSARNLKCAALSRSSVTMRRFICPAFYYSPKLKVLSSAHSILITMK